MDAKNTRPPMQRLVIKNMPESRKSSCLDGINADEIIVTHRNNLKKRLKIIPGGAKKTKIEISPDKSEALMWRLFFKNDPEMWEVTANNIYVVKLFIRNKISM